MNVNLVIIAFNHLDICKKEGEFCRTGGTYDLESCCVEGGYCSKFGTTGGNRKCWKKGMFEKSV